VYLVGGAAGPLGGDDLTVDIDVGPGAQLSIRSAAASVALPGPGAAPSLLNVRARIGPGGGLHWMPEPLVAACGCDHRVEATVDVAAGGRLVWWEELVLGRHREASGSVTSRLRVDVDGRALLRHELALGPRHPHAAGPAVLGRAGAVGSVVVVDPAWEGARSGAVATGRDPDTAVLALDGPGVQVVSLAASAGALRRALGRAAASVDGSASACARHPG
jgi:urease accessory protein